MLMLVSSRQRRIAGSEQLALALQLGSPLLQEVIGHRGISLEEAVPAVAKRLDDPLLATGSDLHLLNGVRKPQMGGDAHRLAAVAQKQLGDRLYRTNLD